MTFTLDQLDGDVRGTLQSLLPPSAKNMSLLHGFTYNPPRSPGHTYLVQTGEHATAPGDGKVSSVKRKPNDFRHSAGLLDTDATWQVTIYHGFNVYTTVQGLATTTVRPGAPVVAGQDIGTPLTGEIFFQVLYHDTPYDPATISRFFRAYDGGKMPGKQGQVRHGADQIERPPEDVQVVIEGDIRYFVDVYCRKEPILLNIDFGGTGAKAGFAAIGQYGTDAWNVYTHSALTTTDGTLCIQLLPDAQTATGTMSLYSGTLVECLHTGTTAGTASLFRGTLVECLHSGTTFGTAAIYSGTLVECLHTGTTAGTASLFSGTLVECLHAGTVSSLSALSSGSLVLDDPIVQPAYLNLWMTTGTRAVALIYLVGTNNMSSAGYFAPETDTLSFTVMMTSGTKASIPP